MFKKKKSKISSERDREDSIHLKSTCCKKKHTQEKQDPGNNRRTRRQKLRNHPEGRTKGKREKKLKSDLEPLQESNL